MEAIEKMKIDLMAAFKTEISALKDEIAGLLYKVFLRKLKNISNEMNFPVSNFKKISISFKFIYCSDLSKQVKEHSSEGGGVSRL